MRSLLIIGGTGVLSLSVVKEAVKNNIKVTVINRGNQSSLLPSGVKVILSDCHNFSYLKDVLVSSYYDAVIDFLCYDVLSLENSFNFYSRYASQYIFISSMAVIDSRTGSKLAEDAPKILPMWDYSINKWACECKLCDMATKRGVNYTIVRPAVTYDDTRIPYGVTPPYGYHWTIVARILAGKPIIRWNKGVNKCPMLRVEDFAVGVVGLIGNVCAYGEAFNVCGDDEYSFNNVLDILSDILETPVITVDVTSAFYAQEVPWRSGEILGGRSIDCSFSNDKIKSLVPAFKQTISLKDGISHTIKAYKERNFQKGIDWTFDGQTDYIIKKWCKINEIYEKKLNLRFVDYLNNATIYDRFSYYKSAKKDNALLTIYNLIRSIN